MVPLNHEQKTRETYRSLQINILYTITLNGKQTNPTLMSILKSDKSSVRRAIKRLLEKEHVRLQEEKEPKVVGGVLQSFTA